MNSASFVTVRVTVLTDLTYWYIKFKSPTGNFTETAPGKTDHDFQIEVGNVSVSSFRNSYFEHSLLNGPKLAV